MRHWPLLCVLFAMVGCSREPPKETMSPQAFKEQLRSVEGPLKEELRKTQGTRPILGR